MDLGNSLANFWNKNTVITSVITKIITDVFMQEKNIDISDYLQSVSIMENVILVKTGNPMMNGELLLFADKIQKSCQESLNNMWMDIENMKIKYV